MEEQSDSSGVQPKGEYQHDAKMAALIRQGVDGLMAEGMEEADAVAAFGLMIAAMRFVTPTPTPSAVEVETARVQQALKLTVPQNDASGGEGA